MSGVLRLVLFQARRDRVALPVWILGITLLGFATSTAVATQFGDDASQAAILTLAASNPAFLFLRGLPDGTGVGAVVFFQGYAFTAVLAGLMSTFLVVRHTRSDEEHGRAELLGAVPLPRAASLVATLVLGTAANLLLAVFVAAGYIAAGLPAGGALAAGAAVGTVGVFFAGLAALAAQALPTGRGANGAAAGLVGAAYLVRGVGDALGTPSADLLHVASAWPSLLSPIGWGQRVRPFTSPDLAALLVPLAAATVLAALAVLVRRRRDVGASLLRQRNGRERAGAEGASFLGLAWRLQRGPVLGWCVGAATMGAVAGALGPVVSESASGMGPIRDLIARLVPGGQTGLVDIFVTALLGITGVFAAAAGIQAVLRMRAEETEGRAELLLSAPASRARWLGANLLAAAVSTALV
ncbi:MAG: polyketide antibiotic transporter, partial [Actinomycetes bacterium]